MRPTLPTTLSAVVCCCLVLFGQRGGQCASREFVESFDGPNTSWTVRFDKSQTRLDLHRRGQFRQRGARAEKLIFETSHRGAQIQLEHELPPARVIDDLNLSLQVRSNRAGAVLYLRVVFPNEIDPTTGETLNTYISGPRHENVQQWKELNGTTPEKQITSRLALLRARLHKPGIDASGLYVDRAMLVAEFEPGPVEIFIDNLRFGPIISPQDAETIIQAREQKLLEETLPVELRLNRLLVHSRPFFLRMIAYHGEDLGGLADAGFNTIIIPDLNNQALIGSLRSQGLWAAAIPPGGTASSDEPLNAANSNILPFTKKTAGILFWYVGTRIPPEQKDRLIAWNDQILNADKHYRRPVMGDVGGLEDIYSRHVAMMGVSRPVINTSRSFKDYRDWLLERRKLSRPGSFLWTWIQTGPASANVSRRSAGRRAPIVIEPEQIRLAVYAALAAECRGIGYWKTQSLDESAPGGLERRLAITQLNMELDLLEPMLATGTLVGQVPFAVRQNSSQRSGQSRLGFRNSRPERPERNALLRARDDRMKRASQIGDEMEAAIIRNDFGTLLLPIWYENNAQFVPGQMVANDVTIVVPGVDETAAAWEVTPTSLRSIRRKAVAGGTEITLDKFDQTTAVLFTSDRQFITHLRQKIASIAAKSSEVSIELAEAKLERVRQVDGELQKLGVGQPDAPNLLSRAAEQLQQAKTAHQRGDLQAYHSARLDSSNALQLLRILQRAHWNDAVRSFGSPTSSPHTLCFNTLPDHWRMVARIGRSPNAIDGNILRSGDFEDIDTMIAERWQHTQIPVDGVHALAELYSSARKGKYSLRLVAVPDSSESARLVIDRHPVTISTPPLTVRSGQLVHISGWVRVVSPIRGCLDGVMLYDNHGGPVSALRWRDAHDWQRFALVREIQRSGPLTITMALTGTGEVHFDDLKVIPHTPRSESVGDQVIDSPPRSSPIDLLQRIPGLGGRSRRK